MTPRAPALWTPPSVGLPEGLRAKQWLRDDAKARLRARVDGRTRWCPNVGPMVPRLAAATIVQVKSATANAGSAACTLTATTAGTLLYAFVIATGTNTTTINAPTDASNTWTPHANGQITGVSSSLSLSIHSFSVTSSAAGVTSVTATASTTGVISRLQIIIYEILGALTSSPIVSTSDAGTNNSTTAAAVPSFTPAQAETIVIAGYGTTGNRTFTVGSGYTIDAGGVQNKAVCEHQIFTSASAQTCPLTISSGGGLGWLGRAVAIGAASLGANPTLVLDTTDGETFTTTQTPTIRATGSDAEGGDLEYEFRWGEAADLASGTNLTDVYDTAVTGFDMHPNPHSSKLTWMLNIACDDLPGMAWQAKGGVLHQIERKWSIDASSVGFTNGTAYLVTHEMQGTLGVNAAPKNPATWGDDGATPAHTFMPTPGWLAISDGLAVTDSPTAATWYAFAHSGVNRLRTIAGRWYSSVLIWVPATALYDNTMATKADGAGTRGGGWVDSYISANWGSHGGAWDILQKVTEVQTVTTKSSVTDAGFVNQVNGGNTHPFTAGQQNGYTFPTALAYGKWFYQWRVKDPSGLYSAWSAIRNFWVSPSVAGASGSGMFLLSGVAT